MRQHLFLCSALFALNAHAGEPCDRRATLAGSMVAMKNSMREELRTKSVSGPMGEVWRYLTYFSVDEHKKLGDTLDQITHTAKLISENDISGDWRIEMLVYDEFFRAVCEVKLNVLDIPTVNAGALGSCFGEAPPGDKDFPQCVRDHVNMIRARVNAK